MKLVKLIILGIAYLLIMSNTDVCATGLQDSLFNFLQGNYLVDTVYELSPGDICIGLKDKIWNNPKDTKSLFDSTLAIARHFDISFDEVIHADNTGKTIAKIYRIMVEDTTKHQIHEIITLKNDYNAYRKYLRNIKQERENMKVREKFAETYEYELLDKEMMDTKIFVRGEWKRNLIIQYVLMDRVMAHHWIKNQTFYTMIKNLGFETVEFRDGYSFNVKYKIE